MIVTIPLDEARYLGQTQRLSFVKLKVFLLSLYKYNTTPKSAPSLLGFHSSLQLRGLETIASNLNKLDDFGLAGLGNPTKSMDCERVSNVNQKACLT